MADYFIESSNTICCFCLSIGRTLTPLKLIQTLQIQEINMNIEDNICWECIALMNKLYKFKNQVSQAQHMLKYNKFNLKSLSNLSYVTKQKYDLEIVQDKPEKVEPPDYFEFNNCNETSNDYDFKDNSAYTIVNDNESEDCDKTFLLDITKVEPIEISEILPKLKKSKKNIKLNRINKKSTKLNDKFDIRIISETDMMKTRDLDKSTTWFKDSPFKCESCILGYRLKEKYDKHVFNKHSVNCGKYICNICDVRFMNKKDMAIHCETHYKQYQCRLCKVSSHQLKVMLRHYIKEHEKRKYICKLCENEFSTWRALRYHRDMMHKEKPKCEQCGRIFPNETNLKRHLVLHTDLPLLECHICHKSYKGKWGLKSHMRFHDDTQATEDAYCAECDIQFKNVFLYKSHLKKNSKHITPDFKKHVCPECGKRFLEKIFLKRHYDGVHLKKKDHVCHICCKMYVKAYSLRQHIKLVHEGNKKPKNKVCDICNKRFTCKAFLKQHLNSHTGERPYCCNQCSATFGYASALYMHTKLIHLKLKRGEKTSGSMHETEYNT